MGDNGTFAFSHQFSTMTANIWHFVKIWYCIMIPHCKNSKSKLHVHNWSSWSHIFCGQSHICHVVFTKDQSCNSWSNDVFNFQGTFPEMQMMAWQFLFKINVYGIDWVQSHCHFVDLCLHFKTFCITGTALFWCADLEFGYGNCLPITHRLDLLWNCPDNMANVNSDDLD